MVQTMQTERVQNDRSFGHGGAITTTEIPTTIKQTTRIATDTQRSTAERLNITANILNRAMQQSSQNLEFSVDASTKKMIIKISDSGTGELIRQIPAEEMLAVARSIDNFLGKHQFQHGQLLTQKA